MLGEKLFVAIGVLLLGQSCFASENLDEKAIVDAFKAREILRKESVEINTLEEQDKFLEAYTIAAKLKTRDDALALGSKCNLSTLLQTFSEEEAIHFAEISGIDKNAIYKDDIVERTFEDLLDLHHSAIFGDNFKLGMKAKIACKILLNKHPNCTFQKSIYEARLTFAEILENTKNTYSMGRELFERSGKRAFSFFYPDDKEKALKIYCDEEARELKD